MEPQKSDNEAEFGESLFSSWFFRGMNIIKPVIIEELLILSQPHCDIWHSDMVEMAILTADPITDLIIGASLHLHCQEYLVNFFTLMFMSIAVSIFNNADDS